MSLESAKRLGFISSIISIIMPIIYGISFGAIYALIFSSVFASISHGSLDSFFNPQIFSTALISISVVVSIISLVGYVMFLVAMYRLSKRYSEPSIFNNLLKALIISIVWAVVVCVLIYFSISASLNAQINAPSPSPTIFMQLMIPVIVIIIGSIPVSIICGFLYKWTFDKVGEHSGVENFKTAGLLYLIGSALSLIGGGVITWISWIFAAMGFNKLTSIPAKTGYFSTTPSGANTFCSYCGAENKSDAKYCIRCGNSLNSA